MTAVNIISAKRSAIGSFGGSLSSLSPVEIASPVVKNLLLDTGVSEIEIGLLIAGNVLGAGHGMNIARQIALASGLPETGNAYTINMVCGSGLQSIGLAAQAIKAGDSDLVVAGGVESMSQAGFISFDTRFGARMGTVSLIDLMLQDGLTDAFGNGHMGCTAENIASQFGITRESQDEFAAKSQQRAVAAIRAGKFLKEIVPVEVRTRKSIISFAEDEYPRADSTVEELAKLRPAFTNDGSVTAGNASGINDGAAFILLASDRAVAEYSLKPIARLIASATGGVSPSVMGLGPTVAVPKVLKTAKWNMESLAVIESNEAFAVQAVAVGRELAFPDELVNAWGGAIALGHPIGASGARILVTLLSRMQTEGAERGLATLCVGGGQGVAALVELCS